MPKVTYTAAKGLVQEAGSGISFDQMPFTPVQDVTGNQLGADVAITVPGVYKFASAFAHSASLPVASQYPGATFVFRAGGAYAFALTGSAEASGTKVFAGSPGAPGTAAAQGSKLTLPNIANSSVVLVSDGANYVVMGASGSYSITGT